MKDSFHGVLHLIEHLDISVSLCSLFSKLVLEAFHLLIKSLRLELHVNGIEFLEWLGRWGHCLLFHFSAHLHVLLLGGSLLNHWLGQWLRMLWVVYLDGVKGLFCNLFRQWHVYWLLLRGFLWSLHILSWFGLWLCLNLCWNNLWLSLNWSWLRYWLRILFLFNWSLS